MIDAIEYAFFEYLWPAAAISCTAFALASYIMGSDSDVERGIPLGIFFFGVLFPIFIFGGGVALAILIAVQPFRWARQYYQRWYREKNDLQRQQRP